MATKRITDLATSGDLQGTELVEVSRLSNTVRVTGTTLSAQASDNSFNDSAAGFVTAGFAVGDRVNVAGFTGNTANNIFVGVVTALTADKMTIGGADGDVIVDDAAGESVTIAKWVSRRSTVSEIGAASNRTGGGGGGLGWTKVYEWNHSVSGDIASPVVSLDGYDEAIVIIRGGIFSTTALPPRTAANLQGLAIVVSTNGGASFLTGTNDYLFFGQSYTANNGAGYITFAAGFSTAARGMSVHLTNLKANGAPYFTSSLQTITGYVDGITTPINAIRIQGRTTEPGFWIAGRIIVMAR